MTLNVPFKDCDIQIDNNMLKFTLRFLRPNASQSNDDIILVYSGPSSPDLFRVVYRPGDLDSGLKYETHMTRTGVIEYVSDILKSMRYDVDPYDRIQLLTDLHPSVMYSVADMDDGVARRSIENMVYASLRTQVKRTFA